MNNQYNYPVKYALLEIKEKGGWNDGYEESTQGFIASKCYVLESDIVYNSDGSSNLIHKVVFPYDNYSIFKESLSGGIHDLGVANTPSYDVHNNPFPVTIVDEIYDTYETAQEASKEKNEELKASILSKISTDDAGWIFKYEVLKNNYDKKIAINALFEELITEKTKDMVTTLEQKDLFVKTLRPIKK